MPDTKKNPSLDGVVDIDALERDDAAPPFKITLDGSEYTLTDPAELPWKVLANLSSDSSEFLGIAVPKAKRVAFNDAVAELPSWKVRRLVDMYMRHYGMPRPGESTGSSAY